MAARKLNILYLTNATLESRGSQALFQSVRKFCEEGHTVFFICCDTSIKSEGVAQVDGYVSDRLTYFTLCQPLSIFWKLRWFPVGLKSWFRLFSFVFKTYRVASRVIRDQKIDVVCGYEVLGAVSARLVKARFGLPTFTRFQGTILKDKLTLPPILLWYRYGFHLLGLRSPGDLTIMTDDGTGGDEVLSRIRAPIKELRFWRNGVMNVSSATPTEIKELRERFAIPDSAHILLMVNRLVSWKRIDRALYALKAYKEKYGADTCLLICGYGSEQSRLMNLANELGVADLVRWVGIVPFDELYKFYCSAEVFLSLNDLSNLGNPLFEAMRFGLPIVTLNTGDTSRMIQHHVNAVLLDPVEPLAPKIADAIAELLQNSHLRSSMKLNTLEYVTRHFESWDQRSAKEVHAVEAMATKYFGL